MRVVRRIERGLTPSPGRNSAGITYPAESSLPRPTHALPASGISLPAGSFVPCVRASGALLVTRPNGEGWPVLFTDALDDWIRDAVGCGIHTMQKFAVKLRYGISAVRCAICEPWSNDQTEGQINRLKMLKRAMYGRASVALLRARMRHLHEIEDHQI
jgi:Transposase